MNHNLYETRTDRLRQLFSAHPEAVACLHCGSPIRPHRAPRVWEHVTTGLPRCVGTDQVQTARPLEGQTHLFATTAEEAAA